MTTVARKTTALLAIYIAVSMATSQDSIVNTSPWTGIIRPGCLVEQIGSLYPVNDHIDVEIDLHLIPELENKISRQRIIANRITKELANTDSLDNEFKEPLINLLLTSISTLDDFIDQQPRTRTTRGLFNIGGSLANFLFGITTDTSLASKLEIQNKAINSAVKTFSTALDAFSQVNIKLKVIRKTINIISTSLESITNQTNQLRQFALITNSLMLFSNQVHHLADDLRALTTNLVLASNGEVVPSLLPERELLRILLLFTADSNRQTLFPINEIHLYYPYLTAILHPDTLHVLIPLMPVDIFKAYRIHPFPTNLNGTTLIATLNQDIVLRSSNGKSISTISNMDFDDCKRAIPKLTICFNLILPETAYLAPSCARSIMTNLPGSSTCMFDELVLKTPFHTSFNHTHYLFFPDETAIVITCNGTHKDDIVKGAYAFPTSCSLHSNIISLKAHHTLHATGHPTHDFSNYNVTLNFHQIHIPNTHIRFLTKADTTVFTLPSPHLSFGYPILTSAIPPFIIAIAVAIYFLHKQHCKTTSPTPIAETPTIPTPVANILP